ncbi:MAG: response regulator transcription factor [Alphaproteobacteria bacterium]|nr:response regulator transcription factor [Alphaproteobacteria bacterium]
MIRALIADDEPRARSRMRRLLGAFDDVVVLGEAAHGEEAVQKVLELQPQVLFLDVRMPGLDGLAVATRLRDYLPETVRPVVVFTTAHREHAVDAFGLASLDYLLKPVEHDRLAETLRRVRRSLWERPGLVAPAPTAPPRPATLTAVRGQAQIPVAVGSVTLVQVEDGEVYAYTADGERHRLQDSLAEIEATLPSPPFVKVSRAALVAGNRVERMVPRDSGTWEAVLEGGQTVAVSRRRARHVRESLGLD